MTTISFWARGDSSSANNASINSQGTNTTPTTELTFSSGENGDVELDYNNGGFDDDTTVIVDGVEMNFTVEFSGTLPYDNKLSNVAGENVQGREVVVITTEDGQRYYFMTDGSGSYAVMDDMPNGAIAIENVSTSGPVLVCFAGGTRIMTPMGERPVEDLREGDLICTADGRNVPLRWIGKRRVETVEQMLHPELRPVVVPAGLFGPDLPCRDLHLSRQHRIKLDHWQVELLFGCEKVLAAARHLLQAGCHIKDDCKPVTYYHLLFDRHEILLSNGLPTESFNPGASALGGLEQDMRDQLMRARPEYAGATGALMQDAAPSLNRQEAELLARQIAGQTMAHSQAAIAA